MYCVGLVKSGIDVPRGPSGLAIYLLAARPGATGSAAKRAP